MRLKDTAVELCKRLTSIFVADPETGRRPCHGEDLKYSNEWKDELLFYEFFDGDTGRGCGAR